MRRRIGQTEEAAAEWGSSARARGGDGMLGAGAGCIYREGAK